MLNKLILILIFCGVRVLDATTCNNPLRYIFNFTGPATSEIVNGTTVCKSLQNKEVCCSSDSLNSFQNKTSEMLSTLHKVVSGRDRVLTDTRLNVLPRLTSSLQRLSKAVLTISGGQGTADAFSSGFSAISYTGEQSPVPVNLYKLLGTMDFVVRFFNFTSHIPSLKENFMYYQKERTKCIIQMVKLQAATWCLACDPDYASKGVSNDGSVKLSLNSQSRILNSCFNYFKETPEQFDLMNIRSYAFYIGGFASAFEKLADGDGTGLNDFAGIVFQKDLFSIPLTSDEQPALANLPKCFSSRSNCVEGSDTSFFEEIYYRGQVNTDYIANGGQLLLSIWPFQRLLGEDLKGRILQSEWEFDEDDAGVMITFEDDPGNTNAMTANSIKLSGVGVLLAVFVMTVVL